MLSSKLIQSEQALKAELAAITGTNTEDWFLAFKARYAMEAVLSATKEARGAGEAISQPLTCATAVNPIISAGLAPVFADIDPETAFIRAGDLPSSAQTRAVVYQYTFGIIPADLPRQPGALLLEDCAHCLGQIGRDSCGEPIADVSVHSFGVEKILQTKFGGAVWVNPQMGDTELREAIVARLGSLPALSFAENARARLYTPLNAGFNRLPGALSSVLRAALTKLRIFAPAISARELLGRNDTSPARMSCWMIETVLRELRGFETNCQRRRANTAFYLRSLQGISQLKIPAGVNASAVLVRFPLLLETPALAEQIFESLRAKGFWPGKWYRPLLFPDAGAVNVVDYNYNKHSCPAAEDFSRRVLNLPVNCAPEEALRIVEEIKNALQD